MSLHAGLCIGPCSTTFAQSTAPPSRPPANPALKPAPSAAATPVGTSVSDAALADRPISKITIRGLKRVTQQTIDNNLRVAAGQPFDALAIRQDVATLYRLGQFATVNADAELRPDGTVEVIYTLVEQPIIRAIGYAGNNVASDEELRKVTPLYAGGPRDDFLLEQSVVRIKELYKSKGNYLAEVRVDETRLQEEGLLLFQIMEGPRVRIEAIEFVGNASYDAEKLYSQIKTRTALPLFRKGELDEERLYDDMATLDRFYKDMGFVDVRVDRRVELSADSKEAKVTFLIDEGRRYTLRKSSVRSAAGDEGPLGLSVMSPEQIDALLVIRPGDNFTKLLLERSIIVVRRAYFLMGYIDVDIQQQWVRVGDSPEVDLLLTIREGPRTIAGLVLVQGNFLTKQGVINRLVRIQPGRPLDGRELEDAATRLKAPASSTTCASPLSGHGPATKIRWANSADSPRTKRQPSRQQVVIRIWPVGSIGRFATCSSR